MIGYTKSTDRSHEFPHRETKFLYGITSVGEFIQNQVNMFNTWYIKVFLVCAVRICKLLSLFLHMQTTELIINIVEYIYMQVFA